MNISRVFLRFQAVVIFILSLNASINASTVSVSNLGEVLQYLTGDPDTTICGMDIDFTLTRPTSAATNPSSFAKHGRLFMQMVAEHNVAAQDVLCATAFTPQKLMEQEVSEVLREIEKLSTVVGLTARYSGEFAGVDFEKYTLDMLRGFEINFNGASGERIVFEALPEHRGNKPVFHEGVIFCNGEKGAPVTKPQVFEEYINAYAPNVKKVVIVDDTSKHLDDFQAFFEAKLPGVEFCGVHYVRAARESTEVCSEAEFIAYLDGLIRIIKTGYAN